MKAGYTIRHNGEFAALGEENLVVVIQCNYSKMVDFFYQYDLELVDILDCVVAIWKLKPKPHVKIA